MLPNRPEVVLRHDDLLTLGLEAQQASPDPTLAGATPLQQRIYKKLNGLASVFPVICEEIA